jgi:hypothetical protein
MRRDPWHVTGMEVGTGRVEEFGGWKRCSAQRRDDSDFAPKQPSTGAPVPMMRLGEMTAHPLHYLPVDSDREFVGMNDHIYILAAITNPARLVSKGRNLRVPSLSRLPLPVGFVLGLRTFAAVVPTLAEADASVTRVPSWR